MVVASALMFSVISLSALADKAAFSYAAKVNDDGKYCARIEVRDYSGTRSKLKCRTLAQWDLQLYRLAFFCANPWSWGESLWMNDLSIYNITQ